MTRFSAILLIVFTLAVTPSLRAQSDPQPPYLYYYSQLLGGLIIEHPDGTDSRQIAADIIPPNMTGLSGPGWSPSGKYFAAYGINFDTFRGSTSAPFLFDTKGKSVAGWLRNVVNPSMMQWSPTGEDLLLVESMYSPEGLHDAFFWLIDVEHDQLLVDFGAQLGRYDLHQSEIEWDTAHHQIAFSYATRTDRAPNYYRVTMRFDGVTLREPIPAEEFIPIKMGIEESDNLYRGINTSPAGTYTAQGYGPAMLTDTRTGQSVALPRHTGATICKDYIWNENETYMITLDGTLVAGGSCAPAVIGITNPTGTFWRELGGCSWLHPPCAGWLPPQVDVSSLPMGASKPVQLEPTKIEYDNQPRYRIDPKVAHVLNLFCNRGLTAALREPTTKAVLYTLTNIHCPYNRNDSGSEKGIQIAVAEDPVHHLLATFIDSRYAGVSVWKLKDTEYEPLLKLNTMGLVLEFTDHNERLRARNYNGWKIYSVDDILAYATKPHE